MENFFHRAAQDIIKAKTVTALTGAGMSAESAIPTFRDKGGFWERYDPNVYAHIDTFRSHPEKPWQMMKEFGKQVKAQPNPGHIALAEIEKMGYLKEIITQNVDNLHQEAGNTDVIEFHGNFRRAVCLRCGKYYAMDDVIMDVLPPRCECDGVLKPDAVFFGEPIPEDAFRRAHKASLNCKLMLVIGTETYDKRGPIKAGLAADLIAVTGNPLENIDTLRDVRFVMKDGVVFKRDGGMTPERFHAGPARGWRKR